MSKIKDCNEGSPMAMKQGRMLRTGAKLAEGRIFEVFELLEYPTAPIGSRLVIKKIRPALAQDEAFRNRLHKLFELLPRLRHPYAEEVLDAQTGGADDTFLICERLDGETLEAFLRREGRMPLPAVRQLARQIAEAVIVGHNLGIVHGNLTPSHIVITQPRRDDSRSPLRIKVRGFGLAPPVAPGLYGNPSYLAPEQIDSLVPRSQATLLTDQHALAVILYEALVGRLLFPRGSLEAVRPRLLRQDPPYFELRGIGTAEVRRMNQALQRALAKGPESRFPRLLDLIEALEGKRLDSVLRQISSEHPRPLARRSIPPVAPAGLTLPPAPAIAPPLVDATTLGRVGEDADWDSNSQTLPIIRRKPDSLAEVPRRLHRFRRLWSFGLLLSLGILLSLAVVQALAQPATTAAPKTTRIDAVGVTPIVKPATKPKLPVSLPPQGKEPKGSKEFKEPSKQTQNLHAAVSESPSPQLPSGPSDASSAAQVLLPSRLVAKPKLPPKPKPRPTQCRPNSSQESNVDVKQVAMCFTAKLARDLQGQTVTVLFSRRNKQFDADLSDAPSSVRDEIEHCLTRLAGRSYDLFPDSGVSWSCR